MNTPGFTAEASLHKRKTEYHSRTTHQRQWTGNMGDNKGRVVPQMSWRCGFLIDLCGDGERWACVQYVSTC